jgi:hypothetical protein
MEHASENRITGVGIAAPLYARVFFYRVLDYGRLTAWEDPSAGPLRDSCRDQGQDKRDSIIHYTHQCCNAKLLDASDGSVISTKSKHL